MVFKNGILLPSLCTSSVSLLMTPALKSSARLSLVIDSRISGGSMGSSMVDLPTTSSVV